MRIPRQLWLGLLLAAVATAALGCSKDPIAPTDGANVGRVDPPKHSVEMKGEEVFEQLARNSDAAIDLALVNWLVAEELPEFAGYTKQEFLQSLDGLSEEVRQHMAQMQSVASARGENLQSPKTRCAIFCNAMVKLGFAYTEEFRQEKITADMMKALYADANHVTLAGLVRTRRGSCVSMPLIYLVLGQRLGMPVHLVTVGQHYFIRWEEPGYRMNIETTIVDRVSVTPDDEVYLEIEGVTRQQLRGNALRNLTPREVVGNLLFVRSACWGIKGAEFAQRQRRDIDWAQQLAPDDYGICATAKAVLGQKHFGSDHTLAADKPEKTKL